MVVLQTACMLALLFLNIWCVWLHEVEWVPGKQEFAIAGLGHYQSVLFEDLFSALALVAVLLLSIRLCAVTSARQKRIIMEYARCALLLTVAVVMLMESLGEIAILATENQMLLGASAKFARVFAFLISASILLWSMLLSFVLWPKTES